jgi:hypothetical protein
MGPGGVMGRAKENAAAAVHNLVTTAPCQRPLRCVSSRTCRRRRAVCCVSMSTGCGARQGGRCIARAPCCSLQPTASSTYHIPGAMVQSTNPPCSTAAAPRPLGPRVLTMRVPH